MHVIFKRPSYYGAAVLVPAAYAGSTVAESAVPDGWEHLFSSYLYELLKDIAATDVNVVLLAVLLVALVIVLDAVSKYAQQERKKAGFDDKGAAKSVSECESGPVRRYVSDMQLLAGTPDALISEGGYIIPVERKPLAKKLRDRHVAQLLVYMRLVEEFEGKKPPYGYLVLGSKSRRIKVSNSDERQAWLQKIIDEMQQILNKNAKAVPEPSASKCKACNVRHRCQTRTE